MSIRVSAAIGPDVVACWCDARRSPLHSASCCMRGCVSVLWDSQPWCWCRLRGQQGGFTPLAPVPITTSMAVAQSPRAGHILRYTVISGHGYGPMERGSVWQLEDQAMEGDTKSNLRFVQGSKYYRTSVALSCTVKQVQSATSKESIQLCPTTTTTQNVNTNVIWAKYSKISKTWFK